MSIFDVIKHYVALSHFYVSYLKTSCFCLEFLKVLRIIDKNNVTFEPWGNSESARCAFMRKYLFQNLTFLHKVSWPALINNQVRWRHMVKWPSLSISTYKVTQKTCIAGHNCFFFSDLLWPYLDFDLFTYDQVPTRAVSF